MTDHWRETQQYLMPAQKPTAAPGGYDLYPAHPLGEGLIQAGCAGLAREFLKQRVVLLDGYQGVFFGDLRARLQPFFDAAGATVNWLDVSSALKSPAEIDWLIAPFLGGDDPIFGTRASLSLEDFFDAQKRPQLRPDPAYDLNIIYGPGAALAPAEGLLAYVDLPKNELQFRARAQSITNLGAAAAFDPKAMYKRCYFVDWVVLNQHKQTLLPQLDLLVDGQRPAEITWAHAADIRRGLAQLSRNVFRVRPWFEPGVWGGQWCRQHVAGLNPEAPNYAWSFELITPENGLVFESSGHLLEVSFDCLMFQEAAAVLGDAFARFGTAFPIRFDFLDTFHGGNLSVQCHPLPEYAKAHFGEAFTQEETYYILDAGKDAVVYLGFQEGIEPAAFEQALTASFERGAALEVERYVQKLPARKHDLFLIPPGTIHASGQNNLVLEISATPYIFTFKLYDWLRPDLDGKPRPLNIERGMANLRFERQGRYVAEKLKPQPVRLEQGPDWALYHLPTHEEHFYDIHRIHLKSQVEIRTNDQFHVLNLVEGQAIRVETQQGLTMRFSYAETFVVPAAAGAYRLINEGGGEALVVKAFVKGGGAR
jgi:mannose-6-phosphate isomerase class I